MYRIHQIKMRPGEDKSRIPLLIRRRLKMPHLDITSWKIVRESVDARNKGNIKVVCSVDFQCDQRLDLDPPPEKNYELPTVLVQPRKRPIIVGFGPCGIFAALILAQAGLHPIVLERGKAVEEREKDVREYWRTGIPHPDSNVQFGEGGAGTFSDGKLTTGTHDMRIGKVLEEIAAAGGGEEVLYKQKPHVGTDMLKGVVSNLRKKIIDAGGEIRFGSRVEDFDVSQGRMRGVTLAGGEYMETDHLILAVGHSSRDTFRVLEAAGAPMEPKPFSIGVRVEHPQRLIDEAQYGDPDLAKVLGPAEYKLSHRCVSGRGVYTFCMCPGGTIIPAATEKDGIVVNGMSYHVRDSKYANSALLVDVRTSDYLEKGKEDDPLAGMEFQRKYEKLAFLKGKGRPPRTTYGELEGSSVDSSLPDFVTDSILEAMPFLGRKLKGFDGHDTVMVGVETRSSSPVRILRDRQGQSCIKGLFPAGEGAGYAGGIISAAVDGIRAAEWVICTLTSLEGSFPSSP